MTGDRCFFSNTFASEEIDEKKRWHDAMLGSKNCACPSQRGTALGMNGEQTGGRGVAVTPSGCLDVVEEERKVGFSEEEKTTYTSREAQVLASDVTTRPTRPGHVCSSLEPHWQGEGEDASSPMPSQARRLMKKKGWVPKNRCFVTASCGTAATAEPSGLGGVTLEGVTRIQWQLGG